MLLLLYIRPYCCWRICFCSLPAVFDVPAVSEVPDIVSASAMAGVPAIADVVASVSAMTDVPAGSLMAATQSNYQKTIDNMFMLGVGTIG